MDVEIAPNGRVFVAEKSGIVKTYSTLSDGSATVFADLRTQVHNYSNRGLLGLAVDPGFPANPYVYVYYTLDAPIGGTPPVFGTAGQTQDPCPGSLDEINCVVSARVSRLRYASEHMDGPEQVLVNDWCQQFAYHAGGGIAFGADGYLYVSSGEGARWGTWDFGQLGNPTNACGDPPGAVGDPMVAPFAEGGRLRAQDLRTSGDPLGLAGSLIRIDPATGAGAPGNPRAISADPNERRMLAHGLRNSARLAIRPGTNDVWLGDWGGGYWEEINRVPHPADPIRNFGWPCYEGGLDEDGVPYARVRPRSDDQDLAICEGLYAEGNATAGPVLGLRPRARDGRRRGLLDRRERERAGRQDLGPLVLSVERQLPGRIPRRAVLRRRAAQVHVGHASRARRASAARPGGSVRPGGLRAARHRGRTGRRPAVGRPRRVERQAHPLGRQRGQPRADRNRGGDARQRQPAADGHFRLHWLRDPDAGDVLSREWDLDGDGAFDDSTAMQPQHTYLQGGIYTAALRVTDTSGATDTDTLTITVRASRSPRSTLRSTGTTWKVGDTIAFTGSGTDEEDGPLPAAALDWSVAAVHCAQPGNCHEHSLGTFDNHGFRLGAGAGPPGAGADRDPPHRHRLRRRDQHRHAAAQPAGREPLADRRPRGSGGDPQRRAVPTPATQQLVVGSHNTLTAATQQTVANATHRFSSWSDGQPRARTFDMPAAGAAFHAAFAPLAPGTRALTFAAEADARVEQASPDANFGTSNTLRMDQATGLARTSTPTSASPSTGSPAA